MRVPGISAKGENNGESGAALVEMSVVIPIVLAIGLGVIEFANYFYSYQLLQSGVRDAARFAASQTYPASSTQITAIKNLAVTGRPTGGNPRVLWWSVDDVSVDYTTVANPKLSTGLSTFRYEGDVPVVTVSTSVPYESLGFLGFLGINSLNLHATHQERVTGER